MLSKNTRTRLIRVKGKKRRAHRVIMERYLGRALLDSEDVHHINGDPLDNRIENLQVLDRHTHSQLHAQETKGETMKLEDHHPYCSFYEWSHDASRECEEPLCNCDLIECDCEVGFTCAACTVRQERDKDLREDAKEENRKSQREAMEDIGDE